MSRWVVTALTAAIVAALGMRADPPAAHGPAALESAAQVRGVARGLRARPGGLGMRSAATGGEPTRLYVVVSALTPERRQTLEAAGLTIEVPAPDQPAPRWRAGELVQGTAPASAEAAIARLPFVRYVDHPGVRWTNIGSVTTAGDAVLHTDAARTVVGNDGAGITIGVISDGADDLQASVASGDLPANVQQPTIAGVTPGHGTEGTALLEVVYDVAPGAQLLFAAPRTSAEMVAAIDGLAAAGAQVLVDDLVFTDEPKFEDGPIAQAARRFASGGGLYVTAAGNYARAHYFASYRPAAGSTIGGLDYHALHRFADGDFGDSLRIPAGTEVIAVLQWNDAFGQAGDDFDLLLARPTSGADVLLASSTATQNGSGTPLEALRWTNTTGGPVDAYLAIGEFARQTDVASLRLNLIVFSRDVLRLQYTTARESMFGHATVDDVVSVAAADVGNPDVIEEFSSQGPATFFFPSRIVRNVPTLTGVDGVFTAVGQRGAFAQPFRGTSAAAPHIAGCGALLLTTGVGAATVRSAMVATAVDLVPPGFDTTSGNGLLDCAAAARLATGTARPPVVTQVTAGFSQSGAVAVDVTGEDVDGDARSVVVRLLDGAGDEIARATADLAGEGVPFHVALSVRGGALARARSAAARAADATRLESQEVVGTLECPGDASLGDALCRLGAVLDAVSVESGRRARRLERTTNAAATALARGGAAMDEGRPVRARRALRRAQSRLGKLVHLATARGLSPALRDLVGGTGQELRSRVAALRAAL